MHGKVLKEAYLRLADFRRSGSGVFSGEVKTRFSFPVVPLVLIVLIFQLPALFFFLSNGIY